MSKELGWFIPIFPVLSGCGGEQPGSRGGPASRRSDHSCEWRVCTGSGAHRDDGASVEGTETFNDTVSFVLTCV